MSSGLSDAERDDLCICAELSAAGPDTSNEMLLNTCDAHLDVLGQVVAAREAAARQAGREEVVARVEALADEWETFAIEYDQDVDAEHARALRAHVAEFRAPDATSEPRP